MDLLKIITNPNKVKDVCCLCFKDTENNTGLHDGVEIHDEYFYFYSTIGYAARNNTTPPFTANKMMGLLKEACTKVTPENWKSVVERTKRLIIEDWERDVRFDNLRENELIINLQDCSSESDIEDDDDGDDDLGCTPLSDSE